MVMWMVKYIKYILIFFLYVNLNTFFIHGKEEIGVIKSVLDGKIIKKPVITKQKQLIAITSNKNDKYKLPVA